MTKTLIETDCNPPDGLVEIARPTFEEALRISAQSGLDVQQARRAASAAAARYVHHRTGVEVTPARIERLMR